MIILAIPEVAVAWTLPLLLSFLKHSVVFRKVAQLNTICKACVFSSYVGVRYRSGEIHHRNVLMARSLCVVLQHGLYCSPAICSSHLFPIQCLSVVLAVYPHTYQN